MRGDTWYVEVCKVIALLICHTRTMIVNLNKLCKALLRFKGNFAKHTTQGTPSSEGKPSVFSGEIPESSVAYVNRNHQGRLPDKEVR